MNASCSLDGTQCRRSLSNATTLEKVDIQSEDNKQTSLDGDLSSSTAPSEGTIRPWLRVLGCCLVLANTMGLQSSFGGFQGFYQENLLSQQSASDIAWIGTIQVFLSSSGGLITGPMFDRGHDRLCILLGSAFAVFAYMMLSLAKTYYQIFLAQAIAGGLAGLFVFSPCVALAATAFERRRSLAVGITTAGFALGAVIYPILFRHLQPRIGFAWTCRVIAFMALGCFTVAYPLIYWKTVRIPKPARDFFEFRAWKEAPYAIYCWAVFFMYAGYWPPYFFMVTFSTSTLRTSNNLAYYIFAISNAANAVARCTGTIIADRGGRIETLTLATTASAIIAFSWAGVSTASGMIIWAIAWGYCSGVMSACFASVVPDLSPGPERVGTRLGMMSGLFGVASLISPVIAGVLLTSAGARERRSGGISRPDDYQGLQFWSGSCLVVAVMLFIYPLLVLRKRRLAVRRSSSATATVAET